VKHWNCAFEYPRVTVVIYVQCWGVFSVNLLWDDSRNRHSQKGNWNCAWCQGRCLIGIFLHTMHTVPRCRPPDRQPTTTTVHHTTCCNLQSYSPDDGQMFVRNMLSWSWRSINTVLWCIQLVFVLLHCLHWRCTVKNKSNLSFIFTCIWTQSVRPVFEHKVYVLSKINCKYLVCYLPNQNIEGGTRDIKIRTSFNKYF
jgi:hypothetical protein